MVLACSTYHPLKAMQDLGLDIIRNSSTLIGGLTMYTDLPFAIIDFCWRHYMK
jgi:hypothetical protein